MFAKRSNPEIRFVVGMFVVGMFVAGVVCAPVVRAQSKVVVPNAAAGVEGVAAEPYLLGGLPSRTQLVIDRAQLGSLPSRPIRSLTLRRDAHLNEHFPNGMRGGWIHLTVLASWTSANGETAAARFDANHTAPVGPIVVYSGDYRVVDSAQLNATRKPAPFDPGVSARVVLQRAIPPSATGNLCLEFVGRAHPTKAGPSLWYVDSAKLPPRPRRFLGRSCWQKTNVEPLAATVDSRAFIGAGLQCRSFGPDVGTGLLVIGASDRNWGLLKLPFDLGALGAPGCFLYVSQDMVVAVSMRRWPNLPDREGRFVLPISLERGFVGARVHSQWLFHSRGANALSVTTTNAVSVVLAAPDRSFGVTTVQAFDPKASTGRVYPDQSVVIELSRD